MGLALTSSFSAAGLWVSESSSFLAFFLLSILFEDDGLLPFTLEDEAGLRYIMISVGGVPIVSEPCDEGEDE